MDPPPQLVAALKSSKKFAHLPEAEAITRIYAFLLENKESRAAQLKSGHRERYEGEKEVLLETYSELLQIYNKYSPLPWDVKLS